MKSTIKLNESELREIITESVKRVLNEGGIHSDNTPDEIIQDIESNFGNNSVTQMDSSWYVVGVDGKYGYYEIDVPANGHCRIKRYRYNSHNNAEDDQWYHYDPEWFNYCENNHSQNESINRKINRIVSESVKRVLNEETGGFSDLFQTYEPRSKRAMQRAWKRSQEDGERRWQHYLDKQQAERLKQTAQEENDFQRRLNDYEADCRYLASLSPEERREVERERNRWVGY